MAYQGTNKKGEQYTAGEPSKEEEAMGDDDAIEWDPEEDDYEDTY